MIAFLLIVNDDKTRSKLESIYIHYHKDLFVTAYSILKDYQEAEDVVQRMILKLHSNLDKITEIKCKKTRAYLVTIVRNLSYDAFNRKKGIIFMPLDEKNNLGIDDEISLDEYVINIENSKEMAVFLSDLHQPYADVIMLRFYHDLSIAEIAELLNITENNVSVRINRALKALKNIFIERGSSFEKSN
ncbi:MAG: RNA polymerase sigma factor [Clostridiales bacterium]|nr:RNA polymerase sigma factor [Clostridiales bacterium]